MAPIAQKVPGTSLDWEWELFQQLDLFSRNKVSRKAKGLSSVPVVVERKPYFRHFRMMVKPSGHLVVTVGRRIGQPEIEKFLAQNKDWVEAGTAEVAKIREAHPQVRFENGELIPMLGREYRLVYVPRTAKRAKVYLREQQIFVETDEMESQDSRVQRIKKFYEQKGRSLLSSRVEIFSEKMQLYPSQLSFRSQKTRWGSCNSKGHISLNWRLVAYPLLIADYVVIHELAHLKHQDHSKRFWKLVEVYSPEYKVHKQYLREHQFQVDFLAKQPELYTNIEPDFIWTY